MKLATVIEALERGAVLHFGLANGPQWELYDGVTIRAISLMQAQSLIQRGVIRAAGDGLFPDSVPSQTWTFTTSGSVP
jgi:hypothetical protein